RQLAYLHQLGVTAPDDLSRGQASDLIAQARNQQQGVVAEDGQGQVADRDLLHRFASLEQALHTLTQTLMNPETGSHISNRLTEETANESVPDWLREEVEPEEEEAVQDVNIVSAAPDLDRDGREDKYERPATEPFGGIHLEPFQASRRQVIHDTLDRLA